MPRLWLYFFALIAPLALRFVVIELNLANWFWYHQYPHAYTILSTLAVQPLFLEFMGGWPLPIFVGTVLCYWGTEDEESVAGQFLMLPFVYLPFTILGDWLMSGEFHGMDLVVHPLVILPIGYAYIFTWALFIWVMSKLQLVL